MNNQLPPLPPLSELGWEGPTINFQNFRTFSSPNYLYGTAKPIEDEDKDEVDEDQYEAFTFDSLSNQITRNNVKIFWTYQVDRFIIIDGNIPILSLYFYLYFIGSSNLDMLSKWPPFVGSFILNPSQPTKNINLSIQKKIRVLALDGNIAEEDVKKSLRDVPCFKIGTINLPFSTQLSVAFFQDSIEEKEKVLIYCFFISY